MKREVTIRMRPGELYHPTMHYLDGLRVIVEDDDPPAPEKAAGEDEFVADVGCGIGHGPTPHGQLDTAIRAAYRKRFGAAPKVDRVGLRDKISEAIKSDFQCACFPCRAERVMRVLEVEGLLPKEG